MQASMANQKSTEASIKNVETQVGQLAKQLSEQKASTSFSPTTQTNPKEYCKAIFTISGNEMTDCESDEDVEEDESEELVENEKENGLVEKEKVEEKKKKKSRKGKEKEVTYPWRKLPYPHLPSKKINDVDVEDSLVENGEVVQKKAEVVVEQNDDIVKEDESEDVVENKRLSVEGALVEKKANLVGKGKEQGKGSTKKEKKERKSKKGSKEESAA